MRILFLCIGNSCRSQMAEGFARLYGSDVIEAVSAGIEPAWRVDPLTMKVMLEKNIDLSAAVPKSLDQVNSAPFDLIVNISGVHISGRVPVETWEVRDPVNESEKVFRDVAAQIESLVMNLILRLRREAKKAKKAREAPLPAPQFDS